mmetsp:Transcript_76333/g.236381  ORF Transcript_76333/g.236381 Transcript_76333/m.236381 type:complete len:407 (+) Transcript_76333:434-1654(+)
MLRDVRPGPEHIHGFRPCDREEDGPHRCHGHDRVHRAQLLHRPLCRARHDDVQVRGHAEHVRLDPLPPDRGLHGALPRDLALHLCRVLHAAGLLRGRDVRALHHGHDRHRALRAAGYRIRRRLHVFRRRQRAAHGSDSAGHPEVRRVEGLLRHGRRHHGLGRPLLAAPAGGGGRGHDRPTRGPEGRRRGREAAARPPAAAPDPHELPDRHALLRVLDGHVLLQPGGVQPGADPARYAVRQLCGRRGHGGPAPAHLRLRLLGHGHRGLLRVAVHLRLRRPAGGVLADMVRRCLDAAVAQVCAAPRLERRRLLHSRPYSHHADTCQSPGGTRAGGWPHPLYHCPHRDRRGHNSAGHTCCFHPRLAKDTSALHGCAMSHDCDNGGSRPEGQHTRGHEIHHDAGGSQTGE